MKKFAVLLALLAAPAAAQAPATVRAEGSGCVAAQDTGVGGANVLSVAYDDARKELTLGSANQVASGLAAAGSVPLTIVFLDNGNVEWDDGWGTRPFAYARDGELVRFSTRVAGERNVAQMLQDLAASRRLGLLQNGEVVIDHDLGPFRAAIAELRACAARARSS